MPPTAHTDTAIATPAAVRPRAVGLRRDRELWLRHLDLAARPTHAFVRPEGPRLRRFPDWSRSPAASVSR